MTRDLASPARLRAGLLALTKSLVLVLGVPVTLGRLWMLGPDPRRLLLGASPLGLTWHVGFLAIGLLWAYCVRCLLVDVRSALRGGPSTSGSWSARWATAIAGLALFVTAGSALGRAHGIDVAPPSASAALAHGPSPSGSTAATPLPLAVVEPGECLADVAARSTGARDDWPIIARLNADRRQVDGGRLVDPNLLRAGWCLVVPPAAPSGGATGAAPRATTIEGGGNRRLDELALLGLGVITTAALARRLKVLGRLASCLRSPGMRRRPLPAPLGALDAALARLGEATLIDWIEVANRLLWGAATDTPLPEVRLVRAGVDGVAFLLEVPMEPAPAPFSARGGGQWWVLGFDRPLVDLQRETTGWGRWLPGLVPVGEEGDAVVLVALGPGHRLSIEGSPEDRRGAMAAIALALRTVPWNEELEVELLGLSPPSPSEHCYQMLESSEATLADLAAEQRIPRAVLRPHWRREPLVLVGTEHDADPGVLDAVAPNAGIVVGSGSGDLRLVLGTGGARLEPYGLELAAPTPSERQCALADRLLAEIANLDQLVPLARPDEDGPVEEPDASATIALQLLRAVPELALASAELASGERPRVIELLAYLALHENEASKDALSAALYPAESKVRAAPRLANVLAATRRALGQGADGRALLRVRDEETVVLDGALTTDWNRFVGLTVAARRVPPEAARARLREALGLVQGAPMSGLAAGYRWLFAEGLDEVITAEILDAAHHLALLALASDDRTEAHRAIATGRLVEPASEILVRDLMVLYEREGARDALADAYRDLEDTLTALFGSEPSLETRALYEALAPPGPLSA